MQSGHPCRTFAIRFRPSHSFRFRRPAAAAAAAWPFFCLPLALVALWAGPALPATWHVPGDVSTIQAALDTAAVGDTVLVADGTYSGSGNRNLDFNGREIVLRSENGPETTIIDCTYGHRAIHFHGEEGPGAVVDGFTIKRGYRHGDGGPGGIWIQWSQPTIRNCVITRNEGDYGGGVNVYEGTGASIEDCTITDNSATTGGGVHVESGSPTFTNCDITRNHLGVESYSGGGISCIGGEETTAPVFTNCLIADNEAGFESGGICDGGGLLVSGASPSLVNCTLSGNCATGMGGGIASTGWFTKITLEKSILWGNAASDGGDEASLSGTDTLSFHCSVVDSSRIASGMGEIIYVSRNLFTDPLFCRPSCTCPADSGTAYTLAENSPCLPDSSPCYQLLGARGEGCGTVVVWTGAGDGFSWEDPDNWSTGQVPQPGDHVQITEGGGLHILLSESAIIEELTMCGRGIAGGGAVLDESPPDTLEIAGAVGGGGALTLDKGRGTEIIVLTAGDKLLGEPERSVGGRLRVMSGAFQSLTGGRLIMNAGAVVGTGTFVNGPGAGFVKQSHSAGELGLHLINAYDPDSPGVQVASGGLVLTGLLENSGHLQVTGSAVLEVAGQVENLGSGLFEFAGMLPGGGKITNYGQFTKLGAETSLVVPRVENLRNDDEEWVGVVEVMGGTLEVETVLENRGNVSVNQYTTLDVRGQVENREDGFFELMGRCIGGGPIHNSGLFRKTAFTTSALTCPFQNLTNAWTGARGRMEVLTGTLNATDIDNGGMVLIAGEGRVNVSSHLTNQVNATLAGGGTLDFSAATLDNQGIVSPGASPGTLHLIGDFSETETAKVEIEIGWTGQMWNYDVLDITGSGSFNGALHVTYPDGMTPSPGDSFRIIQFDSSRVARRSGDSMPAFDCYSGLQLPGGIFLRPSEHLDSFWLVTIDSITTNHPPVAHPDAGSTFWGLPVTLHLLNNDSDEDGNPLTIAGVATQGTRGTVYLDPGDTTVTYAPPTYYVSADSFTYFVTDCSGGVDSAVVTVGITYTTSVPAERPAPERCALLPNVPNPFNPVTTVRYELPEAGPAELVVFDVTGRRVKTLATGYHPAGSYARSWDGRGEDGSQVAPGVYFVRLVAGDFVGTRKMVLAK